HTLDAILAAPDRDELIDWLRCRPLLHHDAELGYTLVHAGLPPQWDLDTARRCAREVEAVLCGERFREFLEHLYGNKPNSWSDDLRGWDRLRFIVNCLTRMRYCKPDGRLKMKPKGPPGTQPEGLLPWFDLPGRASLGLRIIFGHWSTLGVPDVPGIYPVDSGCLWGGQLTALRIDTGPTRIGLPCPERLTPG
ncbi:MAG TPA: symmetrical bis(5'-nucleosyl)-tetraphosphatase, partial [Gammaproteobacteria bacterium]|nr:symmetrical bis(5'-nucleosyl)-tetraphosphatase [Gammaproteobacteria bacterium]